MQLQHVEDKEILSNGTGVFLFTLGAVDNVFPLAYLIVVVWFVCLSKTASVTGVTSLSDANTRPAVPAVPTTSKTKNTIPNTLSF